MHEQILEALRRGANDEALGLANRAIETTPESADLRYALSLALNATGDRAAAMTQIDAAIERAPDEARFHLQRAGYLIRTRDIDAGIAALERAIALDPNLLPAYVMLGRLALSRDDVEKAQRNAVLAARINPEHPWVLAIEGDLALRRNEPDQALALLVRAGQLAPDDPQVLHPLGLAYLAKGHLAFAEQVFRNMLAAGGDGLQSRQLLAQVVHEQGRPLDALEVLRPALEGESAADPALLTQAAQLELVGGRPAEALVWLRRALPLQPSARPIIDTMMEAWRLLDDVEDARSTLDAALETTPEVDLLWLARLSVEPLAGDAAATIIARWNALRPGHVPALEALMSLHAMAGDAAQADAVAERIVAISPGRIGAEQRVVDALLARDPQAAVAHVQTLIAGVGDNAPARHALGNWLGVILDRSGRYDEAVATWLQPHAEQAERMMPLPAPTAQQAGWAVPEPVAQDAGEPAPSSGHQAFLYGPPGSGVEQLAATLVGVLKAFTSDRLGDRPPQDLLQNIHTVPQLADGTLAPAQVIASWREQLPQRGGDAAQVIDWLPIWDNALLPVFAEGLPDAALLFALRDPRDMLLDWIAFGAPVPFKLAPLDASARWLADHLAQIAFVIDSTRPGCRVLRTDDLLGDPERIADALGAALETRLPAAPVQRLGQPRLPAGHWRVYADTLAEPFATLTPVAVRLGYSEH
ncbi:tetratricopeptide repeat protein [Luteimonas sp. RIT-PG2_3]